MSSLPFVGVDGEGGDIPNEHGFTSHEYTMLRAGDRWTTHKWFDFLLGLAKKTIYVSYGFDYDVTMMCRNLPEDIVRPLVAGQEVYYGPYRLFYRPHKEFSIRGHGTRTTVNDVHSFFQSSFVKALERWGIGTADQRSRIEAGKEGRGAHGLLTQQIVEYNAEECDLLAQLTTKFRRTCEAVGYLPQRWQGPGQLAKAMLRRHGIPKTAAIPEFALAGIWEAAQAAYYGGRFETSVVGPVRTVVDGWDINSAYPDAITRLPCLLHIEWTRHRKGRASLSPHGLYRCDYSHPFGQRWYALPHRTYDGRIIYPREGSGWYWGVELIAAQKLGARLTVHHGFEYRTSCDCRLFDFVHRVFSMRKALGKSEAGLALKLALNSLYGVFAQSIGDPPYSNPVYAGLITAMTRAKLLDVVSLDPDGVFMLATDGVYAREGLPLEPSSELGGWDRKTYPDGMHVVMPGVYFADANDDPVIRTRGVSSVAVRAARRSLVSAYGGHRDDHIDVQLRQFIPLRLALARDNPASAGQWVDTTKRIGYDWATKRRPSVLEHDQYGDRTVPYERGAEPMSVPYSKAIGGNLVRSMDRLEWDDAPEWAETLEEL